MPTSICIFFACFMAAYHLQVPLSPINTALGSPKPGTPNSHFSFLNLFEQSSQIPNLIRTSSIPHIQNFMALRARKLLVAPENGSYTADSPISDSHISSNNLSTLVRTKNKDDYYVSGGVTSNGYGGFSGYRMNAPFDASMVLTVLVLLIALFFMGFFSVYIRRFADNSSVGPSRRRRLLRSSSGLPSYPASARSAKGVDPDTVDSLPVYSYSRAAKQGIEAELDCAICLCEFVEGEVVKVVPFCGHVFHIDCIETWLASHVTCPLCRTAKLFPAKEAAEQNGFAPAPVEVRVAIGCDAGGAQPVGGLRSTVDGRDTWAEEDACVGPGKLWRSSSSRSLPCEIVVLHRSLSF